MGDDACFTIDDVMQLTGVTRRTVRYYVTQGLIPPPNGRGVGLHYRQEHVDAILRVLEAKERGASLAAIADAEREHSRQADVKADGASPAPAATVDHGVPVESAAVSNDPSPGSGKAVPPESPLSRIRALMRLGRCKVENCTDTILGISDGKAIGEVLILQPRGRAEVEAVSLSLAKAEIQGLVTVTPV